MLEIRQIQKSYTPTQPALNGVDLTIEQGEIVCLLGPSGCGKTTLLRVVAGLERPERGEIWVNGQNLAGVPVYKRNFGFMFQEYALFPHRTVEQNIGFGLRMAGQSPAQIAARVGEILDLVNLPGYGKRSIFELSGGERQRVALARSLAPHPRLLMLDEPLGSLDRALREELMSELRLILKRIGQTVLCVTHDQQEALALADRVAVMKQGRIEQIDTPQRLYGHPATEFVARFLGFHNLLPATVHPTTPQIAHTTIGAIALSKAAAAGQYTLLIRPQALRLEAGVPSSTSLNGQIDLISFRGDHRRVGLTMKGETGSVMLEFTLAVAQELSLGQQMRAWLDADSVQLL